MHGEKNAKKAMQSATATLRNEDTIWMHAHCCAQHARMTGNIFSAIPLTGAVRGGKIAGKMKTILQTGKLVYHVGRQPEWYPEEDELRLRLQMEYGQGRGVWTVPPEPGFEAASAAQDGLATALRRENALAGVGAVPLNDGPPPSRPSGSDLVKPPTSRPGQRPSDEN
jgi:hypothetical protein